MASGAGGRRLSTNTAPISISLGRIIRKVRKACSGPDKLGKRPPFVSSLTARSWLAKAAISRLAACIPCNAYEDTQSMTLMCNTMAAIGGYENKSTRLLTLTVTLTVLDSDPRVTTTPASNESPIRTKGGALAVSDRLRRTTSLPSALPYFATEPAAAKALGTERAG